MSWYVVTYTEMSTRQALVSGTSIGDVVRRFKERNDDLLNDLDDSFEIDGGLGTLISVVPRPRKEETA